MGSSKVRFGIAGFGSHAMKRLMPGFDMSAHCTVTALARREVNAAAESARAFAVPYSFHSTEELSRSLEVDAVFVASPDALHRSDTLTALANGKHVLCEKPMAMNAGECREMIEAARRANRILGVAHVLRFEQSVQRAREIVASGELGEITQARCEFHYWNEGHGRKWINDPTLACGGPMADVGIHCFDTLRYILNDEVTQVSTLAEPDERSTPMESSALMALEFSRGVLAQVAVSTRAHYRTPLEIVGTKGVLRGEDCLSIEAPGPLQVTATPSGKSRVEEVSNQDAFARQADAFALAVRGESLFPCCGEEGLRNQLVLDAAYRSWKSGRQERVE